jgi:hypothetical protein
VLLAVPIGGMKDHSQTRIPPFPGLAHAATLDPLEDFIMPERLADHEETLHVDSRCNAIRSSSEVEPILTIFDN